MLRFRDGKFKIMQVADVQEVPQVSPDTVKLLTLAIEREQPDLIVFTGDQLYGLIPLFFLGDNEQNVRRTLQRILAPAEEAGIPFAVTFGNHDEQAGLTNAEQAKLYAEFPHYLKGERRGDDDPGTLLLTVQNGAGADAVNVLLVDSNGQRGTGEYLPVKPEQLSWIKEKLEARPLPTFVFQHIPVPEYYHVLERAKRTTKGAVEAFRTHAHEYYVLPHTLREAGGFMGETPAVPDENSGEFEILKQSGCVKGLFVGHDHNNSFVSELDGMKIAYTQSTGFHAYGPGRTRGVRIIELDERSPGDFSTHTVTFDELTNDKLHQPLIPFVLDRLPTTMEQVKRIALAGTAVSAAAVCAGICILRKEQEKHEQVEIFKRDRK